MARRLLPVLALTFMLLGCGASHASRGADAVAGPVMPARPSWLTRLDAAHPLVGKTWDVKRRAFVDDAALLAAARDAHFVLLGEKHDNPDHHMLQAWVAASVVAGGRAPALAFEQIESDRQSALDAARRAEPRDVGAIARAVAWDASGWPPWETYAPIARVAVDGELSIVAANVPAAIAKALVRTGPGAIPEAERARLDLDLPLPAADDASLRRELRDAHCGMPMPPAFLDGMVLAERARDATMADRMLAADRAGGVLLVAGTGHTRTDRGVPRHLARVAPDRTRVSIAFVEVDPAERDPARYGAAWLAPEPPFDLVSFTPRANDEDPCAAFRTK